MKQITMSGNEKRRIEKKNEVEQLIVCALIGCIATLGIFAFIACITSTDMTTWSTAPALSAYFGLSAIITAVALLSE